MKPVKLEKSDRALTIVLDSPTNRNAISTDLIAGIRDGLKRASDDANIRAVVLTHTGNTFCAGADLSVKARDSAGQSAGPTLSPLEAQQESGRQMVALLDEMLSCRIPIVGLIKGHVRAGGMGLVAACDIAVSTPSASYGLSEVRIGVVAAIVSAVIRERIGDRTASDWFLTGRKVSASEAAAAGFVTAVSEDAQMTIDELLAHLWKGAPTAVRRTKLMLNRQIRNRLGSEADELLALSAEFFLSEEAAAGMKAFRDKQSPPWAR